MESCVFEDHKVYAYKPVVPTVHRQECLEDEGVWIGVMSTGQR